MQVLSVSHPGHTQVWYKWCFAHSAAGLVAPQRTPVSLEDLDDLC